MRNVLSLVLALSFCFSVVFAEPYQGPSPWARDEIQRGIEFEIFPEGALSTYQTSISRQDFCKLMVSMFLKDSGFANVDDLLENGLHYDLSKPQSKFQDLNYANSDYKYVVAANLLKIVNGVSENSFAPQESITREQAAKMLLAAYDRMLIEKKIPYDFTYYYIKFVDDYKIAPWAKESVYLMSHFQVMNGVGDNTFDPRGSYTREQALLTTVRLYDVYKDQVASHSLDKKRKEVDQGSEDIKKKGDVPDEPADKLTQVDKIDLPDNALEPSANDKMPDSTFDPFANTNDRIPDSAYDKPAENQVESENFTDKIKNYKAEVLRLVNEERAKVGAPPLIECTKYNDYADLRAKECSVLFEHTRPDGSSCFSGLSDYLTVGENIAAGQNTPEFVMDSWMHSPGHRANILNPSFKELSIGVYYDASRAYGWYWVQIFYTPY